ncbi:hypothetical protein CSV61_08540 [Sporosarcina sp. P3]|uniref:hypothetical protein n=1 Tax=Sporosarcina sp. P3 TaxID=2048245 RepID=UPI000C162C2A|nr:hypothetical protein [Sporosarcina sp. P3]PID21738.1 hypothetical protein CSV61_08540 [Sporosarcina sp. P3]
MTKKPFKVLSKASLAGVLAVSALVPVAAASAATSYAVDEIIVAVDGQNVAISKAVYDAAIAEGWMTGATVSYVQNSDGKYYSKAVLDEAVSEESTLDKALELLAGSDKAESITTVPGEFVDGNLVPEEEQVADLKVESVSAIDETGVTVSFTALTEAKEGATITVVDPAGKTVEVTPVNLEVGDTSATFDFVTAYEELPLGTFVVQGKDFDTEAVDAVAKVNAAGNVVTLWNALQSKYFTGATEANIQGYFDSIAADAPGTVADINKIIADVNKASEDATAEATTVKNVADATNVLQLLNALKAGNFERVKDAWITDYATQDVTLADGVTTETLLDLGSANYFGVEGAGASIEAIQAAIDAQNEVKADEAVTAAEGTLSSADIAEARATVNNYVVADVEDADATPKQDLLDRLALHDAVVNVTKANTNAKLTSALNALNTLTEDGVFDIASVNSKELKRYVTDIQAADLADKDTAGEIQTLIDTANTNAETAALNAVKAITEDTTTAKVKELLVTLADRSAYASDAFDGETVIDALLEEYRTAIATADAADKDTVAKIQGFITVENTPDQALTDLYATSVDFEDPDALLEALQAKTLNLNVTPANKDAYLADTTAIQTAANTGADAEAKIANVQAAVNATDARVALNAATTDTAVRTELTKFVVANGDSNPSYVNLSAQGKLEVAGLVLAEKPAAGYATNTALATEINDQVTARGTLLTNVNAADTITKVNTALTALNYKPFADLSSTQKISVAEAFLANFPTDKDGAKVAYTTLTNIKADIDKAITAVAE